LSVIIRTYLQLQLNAYYACTQELRRQCQQFAVDLLHQSRSSQEIAIILSHDPDSDPYDNVEQMKLARLELAIIYKQKKVCNNRINRKFYTYQKLQMPYPYYIFIANDSYRPSLKVFYNYSVFFTKLLCFGFNQVEMLFAA
jgi:hypothetical protein